VFPIAARHHDKKGVTRMVRIRFSPTAGGLLLAGALVLQACAPRLDNTPGIPVREVDPTQPGIVSGTGPESQDVVVIGDQMMRSLLGCPVVSNAPKAPTVCLLDFTNNSRFAINTNLFLRNLRSELNSKAGGRVVFLAREDLGAVLAERRAKRTGEASFDPATQHEAVAGADYFLTGTFDTLSKASGAGRSDYMLYTFRLVDSESSAIVWEDKFEVKRVGQDDAVYR